MILLASFWHRFIHLPIKPPTQQCILAVEWSCLDGPLKRFANLLFNYWGWEEFGHAVFIFQGWLFHSNTVLQCEILATCSYGVLSYTGFLWRTGWGMEWTGVRKTLLNYLVMQGLVITFNISAEQFSSAFACNISYCWFWLQSYAYFPRRAHWIQQNLLLNWLQRILLSIWQEQALHFPTSLTSQHQ